jgi:hypothetical protein
MVLESFILLCPMFQNETLYKATGWLTKRHQTTSSTKLTIRVLDVWRTCFYNEGSANRMDNLAVLPKIELTCAPYVS